MSDHEDQNRRDVKLLKVEQQMSIWLIVVVLMIFCMVIIGGITRLTGSGLSMVEWRPLMGTLPPMSESEWSRVFSLYQESPQFQQVNEWMTLSDFKWIFFWNRRTRSERTVLQINMGKSTDVHAF